MTKMLLLAPLLAGSLGFACGGDPQPRAAADSTRQPTPARTATAPARPCPDAADISRLLGHTVTPLRSSVGCQYDSDDQSYTAELIFGAAPLGATLMGDVREEAAGRRLATEPIGFGDDGVLWAARGNATGVVVGNGRTAYASVSVGDRDRDFTRSAVLALLRQGIQ